MRSDNAEFRRASEDAPVPEPHPSHRITDESELICALCGKSEDLGGFGELLNPCPASAEKRQAYDAQHNATS
jgi:hypothetical protein